MKRVWAFLSQPQNLAIVAALAGGLGFLWKEVAAPRLNPIAEVPVVTPAVSQQATAVGGSAINATGQAKVVIGAEPASGENESLPASMPDRGAVKSAQANRGGAAVNAADSVRVTVKQNGSIRE
jgi:hypothetical protein